MRVLPVLFLAISLSGAFAGEVDAEFEQKCKSCISVLDEFREKFMDVIKQGKIGQFKEEATKVCSAYKENSPEYKFCYEIGAIEQSSQSLLFEVSQGLAFQDGTKKCKTLKSQYPELCRDKYKLKLDWDNGFNPTKLPVKRLKAILRSYNVPTKGFTEKIDYVKAVEGLRPKTTEEL
uniref:Mesencephalic astrocyte-derived neurotrophic factor homolog n=1 Tax=Salmo salar TaxID=8030 RepID=B5XBY0_SALSA|nr:ARMET-like protein precursor [Salmo salar]